MAVCGHQFRSGDESDWVLSTSANFLAGSTTAQQILQELFRTHCKKISNKNKNKQTQNLPEESSSISKDLPPQKPPPTLGRELIVRKMSGVENFDESQHLNGCPVKWLYNKRLLDKRNYRVVGRWCSKNSGKKEMEERRKKNTNLRDKTPSEVKIHKINLTEKYTSSTDDGYQPTFAPPPSEPNWELENRKKKLAAKLNWKLHDESPEDSRLETSSEISSRSNYLRPRPLLGLKPLLSILLSPQQDTSCCSVEEHLKRTSAREEKPEASLTVQSLDLPFFPQETKLRPRTTNTPRWGAKPARLQKKFQVPNQITIDLRKTPAAATNGDLKVFRGPRKLSDRTKHPKSLSALFYELKDKTNYRNQREECFEEMIRELTMDDHRFDMKRFFNMSGLELKKNENEVVGSREETGQLNLVCGRVRIFRKIPHSNKLQEEKSDGKVPTKG